VSANCFAASRLERLSIEGDRRRLDRAIGAVRALRNLGECEFHSAVGTSQARQQYRQPMQSSL
jgi:hypothetical protein